MTYQPHQSEDATMKPIACEPCPRGADAPEDTCTNRHQCWEPCGELGHSEEHARIYRGPLPEVSESDWATFDLERGREGKGDRLARRDDQQAAALDWQALDVIRRAGL